jgi:ADP-ribose pyrophosphatase YjhB (NUDIX family)
MSLNLVAPASIACGRDLPAARRLFSLLEGLGGHVLLLDPDPGVGTFPLAESVVPPASSADWSALLADRGWSPDETVFLAETTETAAAATAARLKVGALKATLAENAALANRRLDETWTDFDDMLRWFERHGQLAKRAWPIATVGGLVFAPDQTALFVRTAKWSGTWGVPGGKIDYGESSIAAFLREIREETGIDAQDPAFVMVQDAIEEPEFFRPRHFLLLNYRAHCPSKEFRLNHESLEAGWFTLEQALDLPLNRPTRALIQAIRGR